MDNSARKDKIATACIKRWWEGELGAPGLKAEIIAALTSYEEERSPSGGWQQRIAAIDDPRADDRADGHCFFCGAWYTFDNDGHLVCDGHKPDCLWQNAKDATPPASRGEGAQ